MKRLTAAAIPLAAAVLFSPPAQADSYSYVAELDARGVPYAGIAEAIDLGKRVCSTLRSEQWSVPDVIRAVMDYGYNLPEGVIIMTQASKEMCPDTMGAIRDFMHDRDGKLNRAQ